MAQKLSHIAKRWNHENYGLLQQMTSSYAKGDFSNFSYILGHKLTDEIEFDNISDEVIYLHVNTPSMSPLLQTSWSGSNSSSEEDLFSLVSSSSSRNDSLNDSGLLTMMVQHQKHNLNLEMQLSLRLCLLYVIHAELQQAYSGVILFIFTRRISSI